MPPLSKDQKSKNAIKEINAMETIEAVKAYIAGDDRQDVLDAANVQIEFIEKTEPGNSSESAPAPSVPTVAPAPSGPKDSTAQWVNTLPNLQPGKSDPQISPSLGITKKSQKPAVRKIITIVDGSPHWVGFDEDGKKVSAEKVPGH